MECELCGSKFSVDRRVEVTYSSFPKNPNLVTEIKCIVLGNYTPCSLMADPKINIVYQSLDISLHEKITLNILYKDCTNTTTDFQVLYIHSKGVKHFNNISLEKNVYDWVEYLSYFNIYNANICLNALNKCDAVGVNLQKNVNDHTPLHYSGNFWWSKSSHIRKLTDIRDNYYNSPEFWVTSLPGGRYKSLWNSDTHHYNHPYPYYMYENK